MSVLIKDIKESQSNSLGRSIDNPLTPDILKDDKAQESKDRLYYIDWLRALDIHVVVFVHAMGLTDMVTKHSSHNKIWEEKFDSINRYLVQCGIPLFFIMSGMVTSKYRSETKGFSPFLVSKIQRLVLPLIFCIFVYLIPRFYISQPWDQYGRINDGQDIEWDPFIYIPKIFSEGIIMKVGQLWFLPVLLTISLINYPLLAWSRRRAQRKPLESIDLMYFLAQMSTIGGFSILLYTLLDDKTLYWSHVVGASMVLAVSNFFFFGFQVYIQRLDDDDFSYSIILKLIGPFTCIFLNVFRNGACDRNFYCIGMMCFYHSTFFAQGIVNQTWSTKLLQHSDHLRSTSLYPIFIVASVTCAYAITYPGNYTNVGFIFIYPIYSTTVMQSLFTTGTWQVIYALEWLLAKECNFQYNKEIFDFVSNGSFIVYLSHGLWQNVAARILVWPTMKKHGKVESLPFLMYLFLVFFFTELLSNLNYYLILKMYACCSKNKKVEDGDKKYERVKQIEDHEANNSIN